MDHNKYKDELNTWIVSTTCTSRQDWAGMHLYYLDQSSLNLRRYQGLWYEQ